MTRFEIALGWAAVVGSPVAILGIVVAITCFGEPAFLLVKMAWLPFVFIWGLKQVRSHEGGQNDI